MGISALSAYRGDLVLAHAAEAAGIPMIMSSSSLIPLENVASECKDAWFQAYLPGDVEEITALVERVAKAGFRHLVVTVGQAPLAVIPVIADLVVQLPVLRVPHLEQPVQTDAGFIQNVRNIVMVDVGENLGMAFIGVQHQGRRESIRYYELEVVPGVVPAARHIDVPSSLRTVRHDSVHQMTHAMQEWVRIPATLNPIKLKSGPEHVPVGVRAHGKNRGIVAGYA